MLPFLKVVIGQFLTTDYKIFIFIISYCLSAVVCWQHTFSYRKENRRTGKGLAHTAAEIICWTGRELDGAAVEFVIWKIPIILV
jgi:hypothetical protein